MELTLRAESLTYGTACIGHADDGKAVFIQGAAPGDLVRVSITKDRPRFAEGRVTELLEPGASRVKSFCPLASQCGGCPWSHVSYEAQLKAKRTNVFDALKKFGGYDPGFLGRVVAPCVPSKRQTGYRNKLEMGVTRDKAGKIQLGFYQESSHALTMPKECPIACKGIQEAPKALRGALGYISGKQDLGIYRVGVRKSLRTKDLEVALWTTPGPFPRAVAAKVIGNALKTTSIVRVIADPGKARKIKQVEQLAGKGYWEESLGDVQFKVSAPSFFQVNTAQAEKLVKLVMDGLRINDRSVVADLYSGVGTFTIPLAWRAGDVMAVESAGSSVRDLRRNAELNEAYVDVIGGDAARELPMLGKLDALVVDPPRSGLYDNIPASIAAAGPKQVAYVSCNPTTLARDLAKFEKLGYHLKSATPVDLFPQTYHVETVALLSKSSQRA